MWLFAFLGQAENRGSVDEGRQKEEEGEGEFQRTEMWSAECVFSPLFTRFLTSPEKSPLQVDGDSWNLQNCIIGLTNLNYACTNGTCKTALCHVLDFYKYYGRVGARLPAEFPSVQQMPNHEGALNTESGAVRFALCPKTSLHLPLGKRGKEATWLV